uniref:NADH dehydrogenase subunit 9 n=1 Tax=Ancoracysta twista TaxID=2044563 RepID=A0A2H4R8G5_9EUKA|nr:NADH dehydrogenase subunit 9 [Ancoracysta twista]ATY40942.1 NADH dehydrogenase subunit 9 [Ancoracysta twista]
MKQNPNLSFAKSLGELLPNGYEKIQVIKNEIVIHVQRDHLIPLIQFLKYHNNTQFKVLVDIVGVDYPERSERFEVIYILMSICYNTRIYVKTTTDEFSPINSISDVYPAANWMEREVWDLFGVFFRNHPDLRRILTDYGFEGHPFRKDFPLNGYVEVRYDDTQKTVVCEPIEITQEFRNFDFHSPWENHNQSLL